MMSNAKYIKVRVNHIRPDIPTTFDLYLLIHGKYLLYLRSGDHLSRDKIDFLNEKGAEVFFVHEDHRQAFKTYVRGQMNSENIDAEQKARLLRESSIALVEELFESQNVAPALVESKEVVTNFVEFMENEPDGMAHLIGLSGHDFYTYQHSLDVCIYSLGLGGRMSYNKADLVELGRGALFHDIGKRNVNVDIICKKGPLDDVEWAQMQKHPVFGLKLLNEQKEATEIMKACCLEHHENFLGNGYPQALQGQQIHPMARIVAISDTYDAMTTQRSYNKPLLPKDAVMFIKDKLSSRFDPETIKAMYSVLFGT